MIDNTLNNQSKGYSPICDNAKFDTEFFLIIHLNNGWGLDDKKNDLEIIFGDSNIWICSLYEHWLQNKNLPYVLYSISYYILARFILGDRVTMVIPVFYKKWLGISSKEKLSMLLTRIHSFFEVSCGEIYSLNNVVLSYLDIDLQT